MKTFILTISLLICFTMLTAEDQQASKNELSRAEHYLKKLENQTKRARGQSVRLSYDSKEALRRIKRLKEKYPDDPNVESLFQRARKALMGSKGDFIKITPDMLKFRESERKMVDLFAEKSKEQWQMFLQKTNTGAEKRIQAFPVPSHRHRAISELVGTMVLIKDFKYPTNAFFSFGQSYVYAGSGTRGYYYIDISNREWLGLYEAIKRYRRLVNSDVPEGGSWEILAKISGSSLMVPQAGKKKSIPAYWGWTVDPVAIRVPGKTAAFLKPAHELGAQFAGEEQLQQLKSGFYTVTRIETTVKPGRLVEIFATAIKEKNYELFLACIDPDRKKTPTALSRIRYHWDLHQHRFAKFYVHVTIASEKINVLKGFDSKNDLDDFFLSDQQKKTVKRISGQLLEQAWVTTKAWDERGRQYGSPKPHQLRRKDRKRWYIYDYAQQF